jgi:hypothetical protein
MILRLVGSAVLLVLALGPGGGAVLAQPTDLSRRPEPGQESTHETKVETETLTESGSRKVRSVVEQITTRTELVVEVVADPPVARVAEFRTGVERQMALQDGDRDALAGVPAQNLERQLPPLLSVETRRPKGMTGQAPPKLDNPLAAINAVVAYVGSLPAQPVKPGDTWTETLDLGIAKATLSGRFRELKEVAGKRCAILDGAARVAFTGEHAANMTIETLTLSFAEALDGSGPVWSKLSFAVREQGEGGTRHTTRSAETKLVRLGRLAPDQLTKAQADVQTLGAALREAREGDLDKAIDALAAYARANPEGPWTPAVRNLHSALVGQRVLTKPTPGLQLRAVLRDLQVNHDRAVAAGNPREAARTAGVLRQVVKVNAQAVLADADDGDPVVRDLAAFALAFSDAAEGRAKLLGLAADQSPRIRGTAAMGLVVQGQPVRQDLLLRLLKDVEERTRGAAALLASRTLKREDAAAAAVAPLAIDNLLLENPWARLNNVVALRLLAPKGSRPAVRALVQAHKRERRDELKAAYVAAMKELTGLTADTIEPYEQWLAQPPAPKG